MFPPAPRAGVYFHAEPAVTPLGPRALVYVRLAPLHDGWRLFQSGHEYVVSLLSASSSSSSRRNALALTCRGTRARADPDQ
ncbi:MULTISPECIES: hypothetical protein [unclassified Streptomyces]|uniref:hypothetical protein n=1 Tax=unclassified Streptomyces TaxID=2593676 RepID=UPI0023660EB0|nr:MULTISPECIES: hypothetical protein [unclassified Streptomyces]MDF3144791.1 hypothetical protein [Streptomyces sp. T21Q-yed]WDF36089.1 hypothetical protein PBV52_04545 [Streptomyces sp. T12]